MKDYKKYRCPCCGFYTFKEPLEGYYSVCDVCYWQDDLEQKKDPLLLMGANKVCLNDAKKNFLKFGAVDAKKIKYVRKPLEDEIPEWITVIDKKDYFLFSKYIDKKDMEFLVENNIMNFDNNGNLLIDFRNDGDLILYDLVCDLYLKVGIDVNDEPTELGYTIEGISDYIYSCMSHIKSIEERTIIENYEKWLLLQK